MFGCILKKLQTFKVSVGTPTPPPPFPADLDRVNPVEQFEAIYNLDGTVCGLQVHVYVNVFLARVDQFYSTEIIQPSAFARYPSRLLGNPLCSLNWHRRVTLVFLSILAPQDWDAGSLQVTLQHSVRLS